MGEHPRDTREVKRGDEGEAPPCKCEWELQMRELFSREQLRLKRQLGMEEGGCDALGWSLSCFPLPSPPTCLLK